MSFFIVPLPHRSLISLSGPDKASFLQGLVTNDVEKISPQRPLYAAFLNPQGKFLNDLFIVETTDGDWLIDCENAEELLKRLNLYKLRSDVTLTNLRGQYAVYAVWGDDIPALEDGAVIDDPRLPELGRRWYVPSDTSIPMPLSPLETYDRHRILLGVGDGSRDVPVQKGIILEHNFDELGAMDWRKGCYIGQELMARTHYRGEIRKRLLPVKIEGPAVSYGAPIFDVEGQEVGEMRTYVDDCGLAMLRLSVFDSEPVELKAGQTILKPWIALKKG
ncbi:YgfZ/GcvT domain-containing protein [Candidatus Finniella inopinata]|uniref:Folate-binding protein n=1 Tax=Candidatus Finniella inopinata TaxID=1696036 RepID=A0A4Q7DFM6_9PROT|nr:folate-binding protein YgfZ [Candidatus Finniella inopinata]RZI45591.1 folate-binding protein [Candidatus Finniella inopinata]